MDEVLKVFLQHGLLGVVTVIALHSARRMYLDVTSIRAKVDQLHKDHQTQLTTLVTDHKAEMKALEERYITKAETWMQQYHDLARAQVEVLDAIERRYGR